MKEKEEYRVVYKGKGTMFGFYKEFRIDNFQPDNLWRIYQKESYGWSQLVKPDGAFDTWELANLVLDYIATNQKGLTREYCHHTTHFTVE